MINVEFKSIRELVKAYPDEQTCIDHLERIRWNGNVVSPYDASSKVYKCAGNKYKCKNSGKYFNVRTQTLFDNTKVELQTWFIAIYLVTAHKKGISSLQLGRDLNVTQKTAWFMLHRIRNCFGLQPIKDDGEKMGGEGVAVEVDDTVVGGKVKNMRNSKRKAIKDGTVGHADNKTVVTGYIERGNILRMEIRPVGTDTKEGVINNVSTDSVLNTDASPNYKTVGKNYAFHGVVDHGKSEYVKDKVFHVNTLEGAFSLFDRMVVGIYHYVSPKHIKMYIDEHCFRYNSRKSSNCDRFNMLLAQSAKRLTYQSLIGKTK